MTRRLLVLGANGQVGRACLDLQTPPGWQIVGLTRRDADITSISSVQAALAGHAPEVVANLAAYTAVDAAEDDAAGAYAVNRDGAAHVAAACRESGAALIHVSTDYVFDGTAGRPYSEDDPTTPCNVYGASKAAGEQAVRERLERHVILRTAWIYGAHGNNFVRTMLGVGRTRDRLTVVDDQTGCPTAAEDLAAAILAIARRVSDAPAGAAWGNFHLTGRGAVTWCGFAREIFALAGERGYPRRPEMVAITSAEWPTRARRPRDSRLDCTRIAEAYGIAPADRQASLGRVLDRLLAPSYSGEAAP